MILSSQLLYYFHQLLGSYHVIQLHFFWPSYLLNINLSTRRPCFVSSDAMRIFHTSTQVLTDTSSDWRMVAMMQVVTHPLFWAGRLRVLTFCLPGDRCDAITAPGTLSHVCRDWIFFWPIFPPQNLSWFSWLEIKHLTAVFWDSELSIFICPLSHFLCSTS